MGLLMGAHSINGCSVWLVTGFMGRYFWKLNYYTLIGVLSGANTNPPALGLFLGLDICDAPAVGYATVYPLAMFLRVLTAQLLILAFGVVSP